MVFFLLLLFLIEVIIVLNNLSTTYFVSYFFSTIVLLIFFIKKINIKFWIVAILLLFMNSYLFLSDENCTKKVTDFRVKDVLAESLVKETGRKVEKVQTNLTSYIYRRSAILSLNTLKNYSLGWGFYGMDNATIDLMSNYTFYNIDTDIHKKCDFDVNKPCINVKDKQVPITTVEEEVTAHWLVLSMNLNDGLSNLFKMFTEFGVFAFIIFFYFIKYILNLKNISPYNLFIIVLFITMCFRAAGYFNGGFIFCLLELFYYKKHLNEFKEKKNYHN